MGKKRTFCNLMGKNERFFHLLPLKFHIC
jgi:hypothetical protein